VETDVFNLSHYLPDTTLIRNIVHSVLLSYHSSCQTKDFLMYKEL